MLIRRRQYLIRTAQIFDLAAMVLCFFLAASIVSYSIKTISFEQFLSMRISVQNFLLFFVFLLLWHFIFAQFHLYHSKRLSLLGREIVDVGKAVTVGAITVFVLGILFNVQMIDRTFLLVFWASSCALSILSRLAIRYLLRQFRIHGRNLRRILFVGTNTRALQFAREIDARPELGYIVIGFIDDDWDNIAAFQKSEYKLVAGISELPAFLRENVVDEVAICLPMKSFYQENARTVTVCEEQGIIIRFLTDLFTLKRTSIMPDGIVEERLISLNHGMVIGWQSVLKRTIDFLLSLILIVALSPVFLASSLAILIASPGPVFFVQERLGLNKRRFRLFKFRTMIPDAEKKQAELEHLNEVDGAAFKIRNDPRITPVGKTLRKLSIDELPQLFNVLMGDMSLVGPRPLPIRDYAGFDRDWHRRRFSVRPGITCLWQITGRSNLPFERWMELDMEYIDQWSLKLDFKILAKTIPAVLLKNGAA